MTGPTWRICEPKFRETGANWQFFLVRRANFSMRHATLGPILGHFLVSKLCPNGLVGNLVLSTFQPD